MTNAKSLLALLFSFSLLACGAPATSGGTDPPDAGPDSGPPPFLIPILPLPCLCPAPQACEGTGCYCPDAPVGTGSDCEEGERVAFCGDALPPPCRRAHSANAERVACCQD